MGIKWQLSIYLSWLLPPSVLQLSLSLQGALLIECCSVQHCQLWLGGGMGAALDPLGEGKGCPDQPGALPEPNLV